MTNRVVNAHDNSSLGDTLEHVGRIMIRYALMVILIWIGALKFTAYESENIKPLGSNSPLMAWGYHVLSVRGFSSLLGCIEIILGFLIASRPIAPRASAAGSLLAVGMFLVTLSFVLTTPGVWEPGYGFPAPSSSPGQFLLKDVLLLAAAVWTAGEALRRAPSRQQMSQL